MWRSGLQYLQTDEPTLIWYLAITYSNMKTRLILLEIKKHLTYNYIRKEDSLIISSEGKTILSCEKSPDAFTWVKNSLEASMPIFLPGRLTVVSEGKVYAEIGEFIKTNQPHVLRYF